MPIPYKVIEKGQPGVVGGGTKLNYASPVSGGEMTLEKLTRAIEKISTVSGGDIRAVVYTIVDVMQVALEDGQIVRLGDFGSLRMTLSSTGEATPDEVTISSIKGAKIIFTPGKALKKMIKNLEFVKVS